MKKFTVFFFLLMIWLSLLIARPLVKERKPYDFAISLGNMCQVAYHLKINHLRVQAFPFDWNITPFESLFQFIAKNGVCFLDLDKLIYIEGINSEIDSVHKWVEDTVYHIYLLHDFPLDKNFLTNYYEVKASYEKRIRNFFSLLSSNKRILFVRLGITKEQTKRLDDHLSQKYPSLKYTLLVLNDTTDFKIDWGLDRVINVYLEPPKPWVWHGDHSLWKQILSNFHVRGTTKFKENGFLSFPFE